MKIIDKINFKKFAAKPKWIIGFSDATVFHLHINTNLRVGTIHSKMCNSFPANWANALPLQIDSINSIKKCLTGDKIEYFADTDEQNKFGVAEGELIGGNLSILQNLAGTKSEINTDGKILFIEDVGEYFYSIDRMLYTLKRAGKLSKLAGLIVGSFTSMKDNDIPFGFTLPEIVMNVVAAYDYPVCFDFPAGHIPDNHAIILGREMQLTIGEHEVKASYT